MFISKSQRRQPKPSKPSMRLKDSVLNEGYLFGITMLIMESLPPMAFGTQSKKQVRVFPSVVLELIIRTGLRKDGFKILLKLPEHYWHTHHTGTQHHRTPVAICSQTCIVPTSVDPKRTSGQVTGRIVFSSSDPSYNKVPSCVWVPSLRSSRATTIWGQST